jgi:thiol-disulfide isomerase/thioredoxin
MRGFGFGFALLLLLPLAVSAEPLDQFGQPQPWQGSPDAYTVLDFAASWCAPCWRTLPKLEAFAAEHPELRVIVVSVDDEVSGREELVSGLGLVLPVLWDGNYEIAETFSPGALPATVVLAPGGEEVFRHVGSDGAGWNRLVAFLQGTGK